VAGGFLYIGAVAVLPTYVHGKTLILGRVDPNQVHQTVGRKQERQPGPTRGKRHVLVVMIVVDPKMHVQFAAMAFGVSCMFLVA
jgi:hypothetical protein